MIHYDTLFPSISSIEIHEFLSRESQSVSESFPQDQIRCSQTEAQLRSNWDKMVVSALEVAGSVDPYQSDLPAGSILSAVEARDWAIGQASAGTAG